MRNEPVLLSRLARRVVQRFLPPTPGTDATCFIHTAIWRSSMSSVDSSSKPRVDLPIPTGLTGGTGSRAAPFINMSLIWPAKPAQLKHHPSPTPYRSPSWSWTELFLTHREKVLTLRKRGRVSRQYVPSSHVLEAWSEDW